MNRKVNYFLFTLFLTLTILISVPMMAMAKDMSECLKCHDFSTKVEADVTAFFLPKIDDGSSTGSFVDKTSCVTCHQERLAATHYPRLPVVTISVAGIVYGSFSNPASIYLSPDLIHFNHNNISTKTTGPSCNRCHGVVSCQSCHKVVSHQNHYNVTGVNPQTNTPITTPVLTVVNGRFNTSGPSTPYWSIPTTCAATECHGTLPKPLRKKSNGNDLCFNCHKTGTDGHIDVSKEHQSTYVEKPFINCSDCHKADLAAEHATRKDTNEQPYTCYTCHLSTKANVIQAISAGNRSCDACHTNFDHESVHLDGNIDDYCGTCHKSSLITEHLQNTVTQKTKLECKTCHQSQDPQKQQAIATNNSNCAACHSLAHDMNISQRVPEEIPLYEGFEWSNSQLAEIWAGEQWFDSSYTGGAVLLSNRRTDIQPVDVWNFYKQYFTDNGWVAAPTNADFSTLPFSAKYTSSTLKCTIWLFNGENPSRVDTSTPGFKIIIAYKKI